jgi:hypothetical protein
MGLDNKTDWPTDRLSKHNFDLLFHFMSILFLIMPVVLRPPLWSSGQSSWLQIQRSGFDSWRYQIFWEVVGLETGPLSLVRIIEELLERKYRLRSRESKLTTVGDSLHWPRDTLYPTSGGRSVGIVRACGLKPRSLCEFYCKIVILFPHPFFGLEYVF